MRGSKGSVFGFIGVFVALLACNTEPAGESEDLTDDVVDDLVASDALDVTDAPSTCGAECAAWVDRRAVLEPRSSARGLAGQRDQSGNVYLCGQSRETVGEAWIATKLDPDGNELWSHAENQRDPNITTDCVVDPASGDLIVAGRVGGSALVTRLDPLGETLWSYTGSFESARSHAFAIALDEAGNAIVVGASGFNDDNAIVAALDPAGNELWITRWASAPASIFHGVAVGPDGEIFVTGETFGTESALVVAEFDPAGNEVWSRVWASTAGSNIGFDIAYHASGLYVAAALDVRHIGVFHPEARSRRTRPLESNRSRDLLVLCRVARRRRRRCVRRWYCGRRRDLGAACNQVHARRRAGVDHHIVHLRDHRQRHRSWR